MLSIENEEPATKPSSALPPLPPLIQQSKRQQSHTQQQNDTNNINVRHRRVPSLPQQMPSTPTSSSPSNNNNSNDISQSAAPLTNENNNAKRRQQQAPLFQTLMAAILLSALTLVVMSFAMGLFNFSTWDNEKNVIGEEISSIEQVNSTGKPFILAFYSKACIACRRMRRPYQAAAKSVLNSFHVQSFAADVDKKEISPWIGLYGVEVVPSLYFVHAGRRVMYRGSPVSKKIIKFITDELD